MTGRIVFCLLALCGGLALAEPPRRPNIVFILADDLGYGDVAAFGGERCRIPTPNFDRLAREGMRFTDAHANASICVPTRIALMTGRYPWRFPRGERGGPWGFLGVQFELERETLATMLSGAGYHTGYVGKWHLGTRMRTTDGKVQGPDNVDYAKPLLVGPNSFGFHHSFILPGSLDMYPYAFIRNHRWVGAVTAKKGWSAFNRLGPAAESFEDVKVLSTFRREASSYIAARAAAAKSGEPFFLYLALTAPHTPVSPSSEFVGKSGIGIYGDFVMETDHCIGAVLDALKAHRLSENTLVIATSDHGPAAYAGPEYKATYGQIRRLEKLGHYSSGPFRGYKFSVYEGGNRVPFAVKWPGVVESGTTCDQLIGLPDLMATLADVAGVPQPPESGVDSISFAPLMKDHTATGIRRTLVLDGARGRAFRDGRWKLCLCPGSGCPGAYGNTPKSDEAWRSAVKQAESQPRAYADLEKAPFVQLFNLSEDPGETNNVAAEHPDRVRRMITMLRRDIDRGRSTPGPVQTNGRPNLRPFVGVPPFVWGPR